MELNYSTVVPDGTVSVSISKMTICGKTTAIKNKH